MKRSEIISYLNEIKPFLNLKKVCEMYNEFNSNFQIDYNNLRAVLNDTHPTRLSEERIQHFYVFLINDLFQDVFKISTIENIKSMTILVKEIEDSFLQVLEEVKENIDYEISNK